MQEHAGTGPDFRALFEGAPGLLLVLTSDLTIAAVSDAYTRATMLTRTALIGRSIFDVFPDDPDVRDERGLRASLERVKEQKRADAMPARKFLTPRSLAAGGGFEERCWSATNLPLLDANGDLRFIIHRVEDVTDLMALRAKEAEQAALAEELRRRIEELRQTNRLLARRMDENANRQAERDHTAAQRADAEKMAALGALTGGIAHDVNNLLAVIIGNLDLLRDQNSGDGAALELVGEAQAAAQRGGELARRLFAFARRQPLQPTRIEANELIRRTLDAMSARLVGAVEISLDLDAELWPVIADPAQLEDCVVQLVSNAADAMAKGGRLIIGTRNGQLDKDYAGEHPEVRPGDYAIIEISDTGSGMSCDVQRRMFEPFFTTKEEGHGGLGLSTVLGFAKQSGGHVDVASEEGVGTTVRLYLPRLGADVRRLEAKAASEPIAGGGETVLVVEDDAAMRRIARRQLLELGYLVFEADRAANALRLLETEHVDLLFTDIVTPGSIDGLALAHTAAARWPELKILLTSGFPQTRLDERGQVNGMRLLSKPYGRDELARVLREVLDAGGDEAKLIRAG
jgi:signal transduction histidine kinase/ActR/RegA family two-component response regulator